MKTSKIDVIRSLDPNVLMEQYKECGHSIRKLLDRHGINKTHNPARKYIQTIFLKEFGFKTSRSVQSRMEAVGKKRIQEIIDASTSISGVLQAIGVADIRNNRMNFVTACKNFGIAVPKYDRKRSSIVKIWNCNNTLVDFTNSKTALPSNSTIKKYYLQAVAPNIHNCSICNALDQWENKPLVLQLDHIDGNKKNNSLINLRLLCPNCHSQTQTFVRKNTSSYACFTKSSKRI